jgi:hypothetical protein
MPIDSTINVWLCTDKKGNHHLVSGNGDRPMNCPFVKYLVKSLNLDTSSFEFIEVTSLSGSENIWRASLNKDGTSMFAYYVNPSYIIAKS